MKYTSPPVTYTPSEFVPLEFSAVIKKDCANGSKYSPTTVLELEEDDVTVLFADLSFCVSLTASRVSTSLLSTYGVLIERTCSS